MSLRTSAARTLGFAGLYLFTTWLGRLTVMDDTNLSLVWPAAGMAVVWFVAQHGSRWRWLDAVALTAVTMVVNMATGAPAALAAFFVAANLTQAYLAVYLIRRWLPHIWGGGGDQPLTRLVELWRLIAAAAVSTAGGALVGPTGIWLTGGVYSWPSTAVWLTRNTVSILVVGAAGLQLGYLLHRRRSGAATGGVRAWWAAAPMSCRVEYLAVVVVSVLAYGVIFGVQHGLPLAFPLIVLTVWAGLRLRTGFVIAHNLAFGTLAVLFTLHGDGMFAQIPAHHTRALVAQLFVGVIAVVGLAVALGRDERADLLHTLRGAERAAADQARLMTTIIDAMSDGLAVIDATGHVVIRNPAAVDMLGGRTSPGDTMTVPAHYGLFHPDGRPVAAADMPNLRVLAGGTVRNADMIIRNAEVPDGRTVTVSATALPPDARGVRSAVVVFHDVTAERRHRDELTSFAGVVAHDLLNPLATVDGWAEALDQTLDGAPPHPTVTEAADAVVRIRRAVARMRSLINDLLVYTTAGEAALATTDIVLNDLVADIVAARTDQAASTGRPLPSFRLGELHPVNADPVLLRQLLENLVSNAVKYTAADVVPRITISSAPTGDGFVTVRISDNGIGIPAGQHRSIFDNFHRAHRAAGYAGTGLGLGICKRIVERHGGMIGAADNTTGTGAQFSFTLPASGAAQPVRTGERAAV